MAITRSPSNELGSSDRPVSGGGMDRAVATHSLSRRTKFAVLGGALFLAAILYAVFSPRSGSQTIPAERVTVSTVSKGVFEDFLPLRARVTPLISVYLDAIEGGRVEQVLVEDGASVQKGQLLAVLSNAELQLSVLARQTEVTQQLNAMRSQELALAQNRLLNERNLLEAGLAVEKVDRQFRREAQLAAKGFVAGKIFADTKADYAYQRARLDAYRRSQATDERLQTTQLAQLRKAAASMESSLNLARSNLEALNLRAPVAGTLSAFSVQVGQSMARGQRLGQIDSPGRNKLIAEVDEFYLVRVRTGQKASVEWDGKRYGLVVSKVYPTVKNGSFEVDLQFTGGEPEQLQRGQTLQPKLTLGDPAPARLIPSGAFYNDTGGNWVFVVTPDGGTAVKRQVRLGRRNADFIEVIDGLDVGEKVLTSAYTGFSDKQRLDLERK